MKKIWFLMVLCLIAIQSYSQAPEKFSYQAVVRSGSTLVANKTVGVRISLLVNTATGPAAYVETHQVLSNTNGLITLEVGGGTAVSGSFSAIEWGSGKYFIKSEIDAGGGTNYSIIGTTQLLSVPYALYANNVPVRTSGDTLFIGKSRFIVPGITSAGTSSFKIGDEYGGGRVAYVYQPGDPGYDPNVPHGIISSKIDQTINATSPYYSGTGCMWQAGPFVIVNGSYFNLTNAKGTALGTGKANTAQILTIKQSSGRGFPAAEFAIGCRDGGFQDWVLPSMDELNKLFLAKDKIGGFYPGWYWSSTEDNDAYAGAIDFTRGLIGGTDDRGYKGPAGTEYKVRAIRYF